MIFKSQVTDLEIKHEWFEFIDKLTELPNQIKLGNTVEQLTLLGNSSDLRSELQTLEQLLLDENSFNVNYEKFRLYMGYSKIKSAEIRKRGNVVRLLLIHFAMKGICSLSANFKLSLKNQNNFDTLLSYKNFYPESILYIMFLSTEARQKNYYEFLNLELFEAAKKVHKNSDLNAMYKTVNSNSNMLSRIFLTHGISNLKDLELDHIISFHNDYVNLQNTNNYSIKFLLETIGSYTGKNIHKKYEEAINSKQLLPLKKKCNDNLKNISDDKVIFRGDTNKAIQYIGPILNPNVCVKAVEYVEIPRVRKKDLVDYGYWYREGGQNFEFSPENYSIDSEWIVAQKDYVSKQKQEASSKKTANGRLSLLNIYLFDYLPAYFSQGISGELEFPKIPSLFYQGIYVYRSAIFEKEFDLPYNFQYPVDIETFILDMTKAAQLDSTADNNVGRDTLNEFTSFFEHLKDLDSSDPHYKKYAIPSNPLKDFSRKKVGRRPTKSRKELFNIQYWMKFRIFLKTVTREILDINLKALMDGVSVNSSCVRKNMSIKTENDTIEVLDIDLSCLGMKNFRINRKQVKIINYQPWVTLLIMSYSGIRAANAHWMDTEFDVLINQEDLEKNCDLYEIVVNTDKAKTKSFSTHVTREVFELLLLTREVRSLNESKGFDKPQYYQGNPETKWGKFLPLLQITTIHNKEPKLYLDTVIGLFESFLVDNNIEFNSILRYTPLRYLRSSFESIIEGGGVLSKELTIGYIKYSDDEEPVPFTPVVLKALQTPHSLRVQLDSVLSPIVGEQTMSKLMTGQTEEMVGFYTKIFRDDASQDFLNNVVAIAKKAMVLSIKETEINEDDFKENLENGSAISKYNCQSITTRHIDGIEGETGLNVLRFAAVSNLVFNRTHICPVGNVCPKSIIQEIGEKNCSICPYTVTTNNHLVPIAAQIRKLGDDIKDVIDVIKRDAINNAERESLLDKKDSLVLEAGNWLARIYAAKRSDEIIYISKEGREELLKHKPSPAKSGDMSQHFLARLQEVEGVEMVQSTRLSQQAKHITRRIELMVKNDDLKGLVNLSDVDHALSFFRTVSDIHGLSQDQQLELLGGKEVINLPRLGVSI
ncbi:hypothetical protein C1N32_04385 [Vibrio diazotrophicus]|uniref:Uncharacterized protein n=1 Tax=Vibrio diazotrophicus TaxID=685 RepID=A0A2J8I6T8_VIBDI|nr:hypothetical protein [Vibrio diazotrophicus]PNI06243.1 hypothetical protein C1N32_04385 [Vibrio diazotrophicus]